MRTRGDGSLRLKSWLKAGLGLCLAASAGAAAVVAGLRCACFDFTGVRALCGEMAATAGVVLKGCDTDGRLFDIDLKALVPGLIADFIAILCYARNNDSRERV